MIQAKRELPESDEPGVTRLRAHLSATKEVVSIEMGISGAEHLAATISEVLAFYLAERGDGVVWCYEREFVAPDDRTVALWTR